MTAPIDEFGDLWGARYLVANPMIARQGLTQENRSLGIKSHLSPRSIENTGRVHYLVYRGSFECQDTQAMAIIALARHAQLAMVVEGDRDRLEAWYYVKNWPIRKMKKFRTMMTRLGSNWSSRNACSLFSFPWGVKYEGDIRRLDHPSGARICVDRFDVLYFNPPVYKATGV